MSRIIAEQAHECYPHVYNLPKLLPYKTHYNTSTTFIYLDSD